MSEANPPDNPPSTEEGGRKRLPRSAAPSPDNPPLLEEADLSLAEAKVLNAFREGWEAGARHIIVSDDITEEYIEGLTAENPTARDWPGAILRASFLRSLFLGSYGNFAPRLVTIACARIEGRLDLDYCEVRFPLSFFWCIFSKRISLRAATISDLVLTKCLINQDEQDSSLFAMQAKVTTNVALNNQFIAYGKVDLNGADIGGQLACGSGYFEKGLTAQDLKTGSSVFLKDGFKSNGEVCLISADVGGQLACDGGYFKKGLTAQDLKTGESVLLRAGFKADSKVELNGANIGGHLSCIGGRFKEGLQAQRLRVGGAVLLSEKFASNDKVDLIGANIGGQLSCAGGYFGNGLKAQRLKTGESAFLSKGFKSDGEVSLLGANIGGQLDCADGHFGKGLNAQSLKVGSDVFLRGDFESNGMVDLLSADIGGQLACDGVRFEEGLIADGLRYQYIGLGGDWKEGLTWLRQIQGGGFQPYEQLMTVYRRMGHPDWAREIGFELEKKRHERSEGLWRAWYSVLKWTIGYGYKPFQSLGWAAGLVAAGFLLFSSGHNGIVARFVPQYWKAPAFLDNTFLGNEWIPSEVEALESASWTQNRKPPPDYQPFNPMVYSLEAAFPVLPLGQLDKWRPSSLILSGVRRIWTFTGSTLLAILALFGVGALGPNRKSEGDSG